MRIINPNIMTTVYPGYQTRSLSHQAGGLLTTDHWPVWSRQERMVHSLHSLLVSCEEGDLERVRVILQSGEVGVNSADEAEISGLQVAAANGHTEVVEELLARGANIEHQNSSGWTALQQAALHGHSSVAARLVGAGCDVTHRNRQRTPRQSREIVLDYQSPGPPGC